MFLTQLKKIINTGQSRSVILTGNIYDLFDDGEGNYVPVMNLLQAKCKVQKTETQKGITQIVWQVNRPIEVIGNEELDELDRIWTRFHTDTKGLKARLSESLDNSVYALELLRQITECARRGNCKNNLLIMIEASDMILPEAPISHMMMHDRKRVSIVQDWFGDPQFISGHDTVILLSESRSSIHHRISRLPHVLSVEVPLPSRQERYMFILHDPASAAHKKEHHCELADALSDQTAGLSLHAIRQLLRSGDYSPKNVASKVEEYMEGQLGEGVVEFKRPTHTLEDVVGFARVKKFMKDELVPGFMNGDLAGALVGGPIGGGKTFLCEAVASEIGVPVIVLKNIRSKWYGETDQIFERLRRLMETFHKIVVFCDEADSMFGDISSDQETERRLTGKIQAMMSDPELRGRVIWFLMTARPHRLSPDIRRPGRMDLILPILDPEGDDRLAFIKWAFGNLYNEDSRVKMENATLAYSAAEFAALRSRIKASKCETLQSAMAVAEDIVSPDIADTRKYQTLQAQMNCTRKSLLCDNGVSRHEFLAMRDKWKREIEQMEAKGIR